MKHNPYEKSKNLSRLTIRKKNNLKAELDKLLIKTIKYLRNLTTDIIKKIISSFIKAKKILRQEKILMFGIKHNDGTVMKKY